MHFSQLFSSLQRSFFSVKYARRAMAGGTKKSERQNDYWHDDTREKWCWWLSEKKETRKWYRHDAYVQTVLAHIGFHPLDFILAEFQQTYLNSFSQKPNKSFPRNLWIFETDIITMRSVLLAEAGNLNFQMESGGRRREVSTEMHAHPSIIFKHFFLLFSPRQRAIKMQMGEKSSICVFHFFSPLHHRNEDGTKVFCALIKTERISFYSPSWLFIGSDHHRFADVSSLWAGAEALSPCPHGRGAANFISFRVM